MNSTERNTCPDIPSGSGIIIRESVIPTGSVYREILENGITQLRTPTLPESDICRTIRPTDIRDLTRDTIFDLKCIPSPLSDKP